MNCPGCGFENREDAGFCGECGASLATEALCPGCQRPNPPGRKFCDGCGHRLSEAATPDAPERSPRDYTPKHLADKILQSKSAVEGERKQVTVLFADVKGSMELAEQVDPEEWHRILDRFFQILADGVHRFEGTVNQYTGDGIMALFGAPIAHEDHAQRACWAALHLRDALRSYAQELKREQGLSFSVRMGVNSGEVVVGKIGADLRMDYTAQGHTVGLAARMQELAESGSVYLTEQSAALVEGFFALEDLGPFSLKGSRQPLRVFQLEGVGPLRTRFDVSRARGLSRFVGRVEELAGLDAALERAKQGSGPVVGVVAEAGVGKSRLCFEFAERCRARGTPVLEAHAVAHGKRIPLLPMLELFRAFFGILDSDSDRSAREKIAGRLMLLDEVLRQELPLVFDLLGVPDPERPPPEMEADARQHRVFTVVKRIVRASGQRETSVTLVEDLHWMDAASDGLLEQMVEAIDGTRGLLLVNFRPEYKARWMRRSSYQQLPLMLLGTEAIRELLGSLLGEDPSVVFLPELIHDRTGGNPFFVEEVVRTLVETGHLRGRAGAYRLVTPIEDISIPATIQAVLAARIDRLGEKEKRLLQMASVIGKIFSERMLGELAGLPEADLSAALSSLRDAEFLYEESLYPELEYAFRHPLTQEVAYGSQLRERRMQIHVAVARVVEKLDADKLDERAALIAHHWEAAGEALPAARWNQRAAEWAGGRHPGESLRHWRKVGSLLRDAEETEETGELELEACRWVLRLATQLGANPDEAAEVFERGLALAEARGDLERQVTLTSVYGWFLGETTGDVAPELEYARKAAALAEGLQDPIAGVEWGLAGSLSRRGDLRAAQEVNRRYFERVPTAPEGRGGLGFHLRLMAQAAHFTAQGGRLAEGIELFEHVLREQRARLPDSLDPALHVYFVMCQQIAGDAEAAMTSAREGLALAQRTGAPQDLVYAYHMLGMAHALRDAMPEAKGWFERARGLVRESRVALKQESDILASLAEVEAGVEEFARARETAERSIELSRQRHSGWNELHGLLSLVRVLLRSQETSTHAAIEQALASAANLVELSGMLAFQPLIHVERAELARQRDDQATRERELRQAQQLFTEMGAPIRVAQIARELDS